jgi:WD40 repeat protein
MILSGSADKSEKLWDANSGQLIRTFEPFEDAVISVVFSPEGNRVAAISNGVRKREIRVWQLHATREPLKIATMQFAPSFIAFSRERTELISLGPAADGTIAIWDAANGTMLRSFGAFRPTSSCAPI